MKILSLISNRFEEEEGKYKLCNTFLIEWNHLRLQLIWWTHVMSVRERNESASSIMCERVSNCAYDIAEKKRYARLDETYNINIMLNIAQSWNVQDQAKGQSQFLITHSSSLNFIIHSISLSISLSVCLYSVCILVESLECSTALSLLVE